MSESELEYNVETTIHLCHLLAKEDYVENINLIFLFLLKYHLYHKIYMSYKTTIKYTKLKRTLYEHVNRVTHIR